MNGWMDVILRQILSQSILGLLSPQRRCH